MPLSAPVLVATDVSKTFISGSDVVVALSAATLELRAGEAVALVGPSGCGKSTLLRILGLLLSSDTGHIALEGESVPKGAPQRARLRNEFFGYLHQDFALIDEETAAENVGIPLEYARPRVSRAARRMRSQEALSHVGLGDFSKKRVSLLSGGERQRVAVARILVNQPKVLLADEPTASLDAATASPIIELVMNLVEGGAAALIATHDERVADRCDRVIRMLDGALL